MGFGVWLAAYSAPSQRVGYLAGRPRGIDFRCAVGFLVYQCYAARRGRPLCLPFFNAAAGAIRMGRHRGLPLRRNATVWRLPRHLQATLPRRGLPLRRNAMVWGLPRHLQVAQPRRGCAHIIRQGNRAGLSGWAAACGLHMRAVPCFLISAWGTSQARPRAMPL